MGKIYTALGLMTGTSMDGVDVSIIKSNGISHFTNVLEEFYQFSDDLQSRLFSLRDQILSKADLIKFLDEIKILEREITIFHSDVVQDISSKYKENIDLIGFHGQTIFHDSKIKITKQLGDGSLLSQLTKKIVVYDFRQKDLQNGGQGAPLTPIFHNMLSNKIFDKNKSEIANIINIGGITNITLTINDNDKSTKEIKAMDIGPGNCLIDEWVRKNSDKKFDKDGLIGKSGKINELILNQAIENFAFSNFDKSLDIKDFDISFAKGLSLEDGCATITDFTAYLISEGIKFSNKESNHKFNKYLICGGGRKNKFLIDSIKRYLSNSENTILELIDLYKYDGDFIESQAFAYLATRTYLGLPITFPATTQCKEPTIGGAVVKNF
jgi:anhydro-N-acetylmuramic acid kinase